MKLNVGDSSGIEVSKRIHAAVATLAELKSTPFDKRVAGMVVHVLADHSTWYYHLTSSLTGDDILVCAPTAGAGRWLRMPGGVDLALPFVFGTADATALLTIQAGTVLHVMSAYWEVGTGFTGGAASAIGLSSNKTTPTNWSTKGDILGGASGDVTATLGTAGIKAGTIGTDMDTLTKVRGLILVATDTVRLDLITSQFTAGAGNAHLVGTLIANAGA